MDLEAEVRAEADVGSDDDVAEVDAAGDNGEDPDPNSELDEDISVTLASLSLLDLGPIGAAAYVMQDTITNRVAGRSYNMNDGASLKAVCRYPGHVNCTVWVTVRAGRFKTVLTDICQWLAYGRDHDGAQHKEYGLELKRCHHMVPRAGRAA